MGRVQAVGLPESGKARCERSSPFGGTFNPTLESGLASSKKPGQLDSLAAGLLPDSGSGQSHKPLAGNFS